MSVKCTNVVVKFHFSLTSFKDLNFPDSSEIPRLFPDLEEIFYPPYFLTCSNHVKSRNVVDRDE